MVERNVCFNGPRAALNFNDGFGGGAIVRHNAFANWVRETGDHGPLNGYARQPHLTTYRDGKTPSFVPADNEVYSNIWLSSYHSGWTFDHDDGSSYFQDHHNLCLFGGFKSGTFGASGKVFSDNLVLFPEHASTLDGVYPDTNGPTGTRHGNCVTIMTNPGETWANNTCVTTTAPLSGPCALLVGGNNSYYCADKEACDLKACKAGGHELGSAVYALPAEAEMLAMAERFLAGMPA